jgi:sterol desaturase/sphingolipid hydroxylase (fatty acid hydroxylase superfamily)
VTEWFGNAQAWLYEAAFQPLVQRFGLASQAGEVYEGVGWLLAGALQIPLIALLLGLAEHGRPVEAQPDAQARRVDFVYTLVHRLGLFRLGLFFLLDPLVDLCAAQGRLLGWQPLQLDRLWPGVTDLALVAFLLYLVLFDFVAYWLHRWQHSRRWWWALHALHHSQRQMSKWSDNRNHLLDDLLVAAAFALLGLLLGTEPAQFMALVLLTQFLESVQHANWRADFGWAGRWLLVSPVFHRLHHGIGVGHEGPTRGCNFGVLFPWWDRWFGTALFDHAIAPTGVRDQLQGRDYGRGFWAQQGLGLHRLWQSIPLPRGR